MFTSTVSYWSLRIYDFVLVLLGMGLLVKPYMDRTPRTTSLHLTAKKRRWGGGSTNSDIHVFDIIIQFFSIQVMFLQRFISWAKFL